MQDRKSKAPLRPGELFFVALITGFSAVALWQAYEISGFTGLSTPGIFPMLATGTMLISALFIMADALARRRVEAAPDAEYAKVITSRLVGVIALVAAYVFSMPYIGFMVASAVFLFAAFIFLWRKNLLISLALTAGTLAMIYVIFRVLFQVVLPRGTLLQGWL